MGNNFIKAVNRIDLRYEIYSKGYYKLHFLNISLKEQQNPNFDTNGLITKFDDLNFGRHLPGHKNKRKKTVVAKT